MGLAERISGRWRAAWNQVTSDEVKALREVIAWAAGGEWATERLAAEADVHDYDVRNFLRSHTKKGTGHRAGLRMLRFAARLEDSSAAAGSPVWLKIQMLAAAADRLAVFEPDDDYLFRHLQRLDLVEERDCKTICDRLAGNYYSHRLSRIPGRIIRSHYEFRKFSPFDRLPHVINRLRYGGVADKQALERTAEGQIIRIGETYVLMAFVYRGYHSASLKPKERIKFDGLQVNLFPAGQIENTSNSIIDGIFLSYVYSQSYEMGPMRLVRKSRSKDEFDASQVGEFTLDQMTKLEPDLDLSPLNLDVTKLIQRPEDPLGATVDPAILAACLSFMLAPERLSLNLPRG